MKTTVSVLFLLAAFALPAYAGEVVIEETDTAIIVEYTGDPGGKRGDSQPQGNMQPGTPSQQAGAAAPAPPETAEGGVRRRGTDEDEARRQARAERRASRRAARSSSEGGEE